MNLSKKITDKIRYIQSQPESVKTRYIWTLTIVMFAGIVAIWLIFAKIIAPRVATGTSAPMIDAKNNLSDLKEKIKSGYSKLKNNALPELKDLLKDKEKAKEVQVTPSPSIAVDENLKQ